MYIPQGPGPPHQGSTFVDFKQQQSAAVAAQTTLTAVKELNGAIQADKVHEVFKQMPQFNAGMPDTHWNAVTAGTSHSADISTKDFRADLWNTDINRHCC